jgi:hypothetical protein
MAAMQRQTFESCDPSYGTTSLILQTSDYDRVHVKNICKICIVKFSVVKNL